MPRGPRLIVPDVALHIVQRGHNRQDCFLHESDYLVYLANLRDLLAKTRCALHAYCLMTNHVHLLLTPSTLDGCARLMRNLGQRYVQYFNRRHERSGTLWEGRFHSCLVDSARYVVACYRYVERNPVRAGMVEAAGDYPWSSCRGNSGRDSNKLLTEHAEYVALATDNNLRHVAYQTLLAEADEAEFLAAIRDATNGGFGLVGEQLKASLPADQQRRLARQSPGPSTKPRDDGGWADLQMELGLRPRTS
jgi:putative transposase